MSISWQKWVKLIEWSSTTPLAPHHTRNHLLLFWLVEPGESEAKQMEQEIIFCFYLWVSVGFNYLGPSPPAKASQISLAASFTLIVFDLRNRVKLPQEAVKNIANPPPPPKKIARTHPPRKKSICIYHILNITLKKYKTTYNKTKNVKSWTNPKRSITK